MYELAWTKVHDELFKKVNREFDAYQGYMQALCGSQVCAHAEEIAARSCCEQLTEKLTSYPVEYLEYLLRFEDPVTVVQDQWASEQNADIGDKLKHALYTLWCTGNAEQDHPPDPEWRPEREGPSMC